MAFLLWSAFPSVSRSKPWIFLGSRCTEELVQRVATEIRKDHGIRKPTVDLPVQVAREFLEMILGKLSYRKLEREGGADQSSRQEVGESFSVCALCEEGHVEVGASKNVLRVLGRGR